MKKLTERQRVFLQQIANGASPKDAALNTYDIPTEGRTAKQIDHVAHSLAHTTMTSPAVREVMEAAFARVGLDTGSIATKLKDAAELLYAADPREKMVGLRALHMICKIRGDYAPQRHEVSRAMLPEPLMDRLFRALEEDRVRQAKPVQH